MPRFFRQADKSNFTTADLAVKTPEYHAIQELIKKLDERGVTKNFAENCIASVDIMQASLNNIGIRSRVVEVQLSLFRNIESATDYYFVGYNNATFEGQIDTHVVLITETKIPFLIDMSLGHLMPKDNPYLVLPITEKSDTLGHILEYTIDNILVNYSYKKDPKLIKIHQKSVVDRILEDSKTQDSLKLLKILCTTSIALGCVNFALNIILIILKALFL